jgi:hypothetical protein
LSRMKLFVLLALFLSVVLPAVCQVVVLGGNPQHVFSGQSQTVFMKLKNPGRAVAEIDLRARISQGSSATAAPLDNLPIKSLHLLAGQTILEEAQIAFPEVRAETLFVIQWLDATNKVVGRTSIVAYPPDLMKELRTLAGDDSVGVFDPSHTLKPLLTGQKIELTDLEDFGLEHFEGKLVILGPFESKSQIGENSRVRSLASKGVGVVWIQPPASPLAALAPSFYSVSEGKGAAVIVQPELVANLADDPQAQKNLVALARLAVHPQPQQLPNTPISRLLTTNH